MSRLIPKVIKKKYIYIYICINVCINTYTYNVIINNLY